MTETTTSTLPEQLVQVANEAIAKAEGDPTGNYEDRAIPAVVAVLRELRGHPESGRREHGQYWSPERLLDLADEIERDQ